MHAPKMYYNKRCSPHLGLNSVISIVGVADRSAHISLHSLPTLHGVYQVTENINHMDVVF